MASLWKRSTSPYWFACFTSPSGQRLKKSTKQTDRRKALEVTLAWDRAAREGRRGTLTEAQARKVLSEIVERTSGEPLVFYTVEAWLRDWLQGKGLAKSTNTHAKYKHTVQSFVAHLGGRAGQNLAQLAPRDVQSYRDAELAAGKHPRTCNFAVKHLRTAFNAARRQGLLTHNPADAVESVAMPAGGTDGASAGREAFDAEQIAALLRTASPDWKTVILLAYFTGARLQDVANMRWEAVDLPGRVLQFIAQKTRKPVAVPLHPDLEAHLLELPAPDAGRAFLAPSLAGKSTAGKSGLSMAFRRLMERANVAGTVQRKAAGKGRTVNSLSFHSLRHSFNSAMANAGVTTEIRQKLAGHASTEMNKLYTHHELESLRREIQKMPGVQ